MHYRYKHLQKHKIRPEPYVRNLNPMKSFPSYLHRGRLTYQRNIGYYINCVVDLLTRHDLMEYH